jgi:hypothetical protein
MRAYPFPNFEMAQACRVASFLFGPRGGGLEELFSATPSASTPNLFMQRGVNVVVRVTLFSQLRPSGDCNASPPIRASPGSTKKPGGPIELLAIGGGGPPLHAREGFLGRIVDNLLGLGDVLRAPVRRAVVGDLLGELGGLEDSSGPAASRAGRVWQGLTCDRHWNVVGSAA